MGIRRHIIIVVQVVCIVWFAISLIGEAVAILKDCCDTGLSKNWKNGRPDV